MNYQEISPARIVKHDIRTAAVFERYGIDFCCKGKLPLATLCEEQHVNLNLIAQDLLRLELLPMPTQDFSAMSAAELMEYIVQHHHAYVRRSIPIIQSHIHRVVERHGDDQPQNREVENLFNTLATELLEHLDKEEHILFPAILRMEMAERYGLAPVTNRFGTIANPLSGLEAEHEAAGTMMQQIRKLTNNYTPPPSACNTYKAAYAELREFEEDLHKHVHLENNILHEMAVHLENSSQSKQTHSNPTQTNTNT